jgi:hypothetical protein
MRHLPFQVLVLSHVYNFNAVNFIVRATCLLEETYSISACFIIHNFWCTLVHYSVLQEHDRVYTKVVYSLHSL